MLIRTSHVFSIETHLDSLQNAPNCPRLWALTNTSIANSRDQLISTPPDFSCGKINIISQGVCRNQLSQVMTLVINSSAWTNIAKYVKCNHMLNWAEWLWQNGCTWDRLKKRAWFCRLSLKITTIFNPVFVSSLWTCLLVQPQRFNTNVQEWLVSNQRPWAMKFCSWAIPWTTTSTADTRRSTRGFRVNPNGDAVKTISPQRMWDYCSSCFTSLERDWRWGARPKEGANQLKVRQHHRQGGKNRDTSIFHRPWAGQSVSETFFISFLHLYYNSGPTIWLHVTRSILINAKRLSFDLLVVLSCISVLSLTGGWD